MAGNEQPKSVGYRMAVHSPDLSELELDTEEQQKEYFTNAIDFMEGKVRKSRKEFAQFIKHYNANCVEIGLNEEERGALKKLHAMWKKAKDEDPLQSFVDMKDQHTVLNGRLLAGLVGDKGPNQLWVKYVHNFQAWRTKTMVDHYVIMKLVQEKQAKEEAAAGASASPSS